MTNVPCRTRRTKRRTAMKKMLLLLVGCLLAAGSATAAQVVYSGDLANETALGVDKTYDVDARVVGADQVSAVAVYSSATIPSTSFVGGRASTVTFTVAGITDLTTS